MNNKIAYLFTNPVPDTLFSSYRSIPKDAFIIGVDGGTNDLVKFGFKPGLIVGDMDSILPGILAMFELDVPLLKYPMEKDETDCELAIQWCIDHKFEEIIIINSLGGRFDHVMGLMQNLLLAKKNGIRARIESHNQQVLFLETNHRIAAQEGMHISLIPFSAVVTQVKTEGLFFPLENEDLYQNQSRGISNRFSAEKAQIRHNDGDLLAILTL